MQDVGMERVERPGLVAAAVVPSLGYRHDRGAVAHRGELSGEPDPAAGGGRIA